jgi:hypothetical protein
MQVRLHGDPGGGRFGKRGGRGLHALFRALICWPPSLRPLLLRRLCTSAGPSAAAPSVRPGDERLAGWLWGLPAFAAAPRQSPLAPASQCGPCDPPAVPSPLFASAVYSLFPLACPSSH